MKWSQPSGSFGGVKINILAGKEGIAEELYQLTCAVEINNEATKHYPLVL